MALSEREAVISHYTGTAKMLHWTIAMVIIFLLCLGFYMQDMSLSPQKLKLYSWHKWAGVSVFLLSLIRLAWRMTHRPPSLPAHMPQAHRWAAHAGHAALYLLMLAIPLSGWLMSSAKGFQTVWFGLLPIPDLIGRDQALGDLLQGVHLALNLALVALLLGHVGAALKHHLVDRDDILLRMVPKIGGTTGK